MISRLLPWGSRRRGAARRWARWSFAPPVRWSAASAPVAPECDPPPRHHRLDQTLPPLPAVAALAAFLACGACPPRSRPRLPLPRLGPAARRNRGAHLPARTASQPRALSSHCALRSHRCRPGHGGSQRHAATRRAELRRCAMRRGGGGGGGTWLRWRFPEISKFEAAASAGNGAGIRTTGRTNSSSVSSASSAPGSIARARPRETPGESAAATRAQSACCAGRTATGGTFGTQRA